MQGAWDSATGLMFVSHGMKHVVGVHVNLPKAATMAIRNVAVQKDLHLGSAVCKITNTLYTSNKHAV